MIPTLATVAILIAGPLHAATATDLDAPGVDTASVFLTIDGDTATLTGTVDGMYEKVELERAAMELSGVDEVKNLLSF